MPVIRRYIGEQVKPNRKLNVPRIEIYQMVSALGRDVIQQFLGQIAVRVNQSNAMSKGNVLQNQIAEQCGFARTGLSNDINMLPLISGRYAKRLRFSVAFALADCDGVVIHGAKTNHHSGHGKSPACGRLSLWQRRQNALGQADEVMVAGFEIRTIRCSQDIWRWHDGKDTQTCQNGRTCGAAMVNAAVAATLSPKNQSY
jgi:hypothetical protein